MRVVDEASWVRTRSHRAIASAWLANVVGAVLFVNLCGCMDLEQMSAESCRSRLERQVGGFASTSRSGISEHPGLSELRVYCSPDQSQDDCNIRNADIVSLSDRTRVTYFLVYSPAPSSPPAAVFCEWPRPDF